MPAPL
jgi:hypothetical protein